MKPKCETAAKGLFMVFNNHMGILMILVLCYCLTACSQQETSDLPNPQSSIYNQPVGQNAPSDAYFHGDTLAYYGSANPWDLRFFYGYFDEWENRRGQRMMLDIMNNKFMDAEIYSRDVLQRFPDNLEALFNLSVALAHQGRIEEAMGTLRTAVELGLPFERYLAGPRSVLVPLVDSPEFGSFAEAYNLPLLHGPMLGQVTTSSAAFWVRTLHEARVRVRVSIDPGMSDYHVSDIAQTTSGTDYTTVVHVAGLDPDTRYYYRLLINGRLVETPQKLSFKTYPRAGTNRSFTVAFGGCSAYYPENERLWDVIHAKEPLAYLTLGDNVYINLIEHGNHPYAMQHYTYYQRQSGPEYRRMIAAAPVYAIWDDHEFTDDVWLGPYREMPYWKMPMLEQYRQNWINPAYGSDDWPGVWHSFSIGDADIFMLDGRFYRTNPFAKEPSRVNDYAEYPTMLGPVQKKWLLEQLSQSEAAFKVIVSPVAWSDEASPGSVDTWSGYPDEREEIFRFLTDQNIEGVILLSSDRHRSDAWQIDRADDYTLYEFASGRLTNRHRHNAMPGALYSYNEKESFGLLNFDFDNDEPAVTYQIYSIDDELVYEMKIDRSQLEDTRN
ncbi:MAG: alkaline phosphatase D family protein [Cyclonatronaceae bacterium]